MRRMFLIQLEMGMQHPGSNSHPAENGAEASGSSFYAEDERVPSTQAPEASGGSLPTSVRAASVTLVRRQSHVLGDKYDASTA